MEELWREFRYRTFTARKEIGGVRVRKMVLRPVQLVLAFLYLATFVVADLSSEYNHEAYLDPNEMYKLYWSVKDGDKSIHFAVEVKTTGWVGFGISVGLTGKMMDADIVIGFVDSKGQARLDDYHGVGQKRPLKDTSQDYALIGGSQSNGKTILKFKRKILACDPQDRDIPIGTTKVIYAYGTKDQLGYHYSQRGARSLSLLNYVQNKPIPPTAKHFDVVIKNVSVPTKSTTYWCEVFKVDNLIKLSKKQHIIEIAPLVEKKDRGIVHHMVLYSCQHDFDEKHLNVTGECYHPNMPRSVQECAGNSAVFAWAVGGVNFKFPAHAGMPIGMSDSMKYLILETHFDNPQKSDKFVVTTGLRLYYDAPRRYDAETVTTGMSVSHALVVPPNQKDWITVGECSKECTAKIAGPSALNGNEIKLFASFPHAHTVGKGIVTTQLRNGEEIKEVFRDDSYDFDYQQTYVLNEEVTFKAGDQLMTYCRYDTTKRQYAVSGGTSTTEEMCLNFIMYYPRVNFTNCVGYDYGGAYFSSKYAKGRRKDKWDGVAWNSSMVAELKTYYNHTSKVIWPECSALSSRRYAMNITDRVVITKRLPPKKSKQDLCTKNPTGGGEMISFHAKLLVLPLAVLYLWFN